MSWWRWRRRATPSSAPMLARMALLTAHPARVASRACRVWCRVAPRPTLRPSPPARRVRTAASASGASESRATRLFAPTERATERIARLLAADARAGDVICLHGDVGMGKSVFSRAYVRAVARDPNLEVPSPTYLLQQVYDNHDPSFGPPVHHFDLYRLAGPSEMSKLGLDDSFANAASLLEWAERLGDLAPDERLDVFVRVGDGDEESTTVRADEDEDEDADADADEDEDDDVDPAFLDLRGRLVRLVPRGETWRERIDALAEAL